MKIMFILMVVFLLGSCSYKKEKQQMKKHPLEIGTFSAESLSYKLMNEFIFRPKCISCHGNAGGISLGSFSDVVSHLQDIERVSVHEKSMPPGAPLNVRQQDILLTWIRAGAPEFATDREIPPLPTPQPAPLEPKFVSIKENIFQSKCLACHSPTGEGKRIPLNTPEDLIDSPLELVIPGNSEESGLYIAVYREDSKRMPPPNSGLSPLSQEEMEIIRQWIDNGAKE